MTYGAQLQLIFWFTGQLVSAVLTAGPWCTTGLLMTNRGGELRVRTAAGKESQDLPSGKNQSACWMMGSTMDTTCTDVAAAISARLLGMHKNTKLDAFLHNEAPMKTSERLYTEMYSTTLDSELPRYGRLL